MRISENQAEKNRQRVVAKASKLFREGGFDGKLKTLRPRGFVNDDPSHASWGLQFGPILAEYLIAYVDPDYTEATNVTEKMRSNLPAVAGAALGAGFFLAGGLGATARLMMRRGR